METVSLWIGVANGAFGLLAVVIGGLRWTWKRRPRRPRLWESLTPEERAIWVVQSG